MNHPPLPLTKDLVLIGGGHTHALVLRKWGMTPLPGTRLTVINPGPTAPYSGMLPGFVAGHYDRDALDIDLVRLARFAGARVILGAVDRIDRHAKEVHVSGRPPVAYDVCSVNVGITSDMPSTPGFAEHAVPAKPLGPFASRWQDYLDGDGPASVAVIGGGVAGAELVMAMAHALQERKRDARLSLIDNGQILTAIGPKAAQTLRAAIAGLRIDVVERADITQITDQDIHLKDGRSIPATFVTGAAGARAYDWIGDCGLDLQDGFIKVDKTLRSSDPSIFAAGDCAHLTDFPRPKAGVYAVREAPVLFDNLCATLSGNTVRVYKPQKDYLKLISMGGKNALGERFGMTVSGSLMWRWKDHIDQTFMNRFRHLPIMETPELPPMHALGLGDALGDKALCGGCGAKVGRSALQTALKHLPPPNRPDVTPLPGDDAALLTTGGARQVLSSDHLRTVTNDPVVMTRIAAVHALGDIWAMGAAPQAATANLILPRMSAALHARTLDEIMKTAHLVMTAAGADIVGGHTSVGDELTIGFSITGLCDTAPITLMGANPGDVLILTKPLGSGVLMAAEMAGQARGDWVASAFAQMTQEQGTAAQILACAHATTDVTGFGLAGHLLGICEASQVSATLDLQNVPLMDGALAVSDLGIHSSLFRDNHTIAPYLPSDGKAALLFDPQTAGGLLAAVPADHAQECLSHLLKAGYPAACIGTFAEGAPQISLRDE